MARNATDFMGMPEKIFYWIPDELVVIVRLPRHPTSDRQDVLAEQIRNQLNMLLTPYGLSLESYGTYGRWSDIPTMPPIRRRSYIFGRHNGQPLIALFFHTRHIDSSIQDPMPIALSYIHSHLEQLARTGLQIVSAMPNWLVTAAPLLYGDSGPAFPPQPAPPLDLASVGQAPVGWHFSFSEPGLPPDSGKAEDVMVAILDTSPHPDRLLTAAMRPEWQRNRLLQQLASDLRSENGSFAIDYDRYPVTNDVRSGRDRYNDSRYYFMSDHGLFVAGIIRDIAPKARIRLIRILNDYGGCDLYNLFAALTDLEHELVAGSMRRLVINLSLTIMPDIRRLPYIWFHDRTWSGTQLYGVSRILEHLDEGLRLLFECLFAHGALIVAAVGNDSIEARQKGQLPRPPRAPARYESTLGVSSVNSRDLASLFANAANIPSEKTGVATFGGDGYESKDMHGWLDAVRGIYISPAFPAGEPNMTGWADWSGTSFATSIISGLGAHFLAQGWTASDTIVRLASGSEHPSEKLFGASPDSPDLLANIIRVQQRFEQ